MTRQNQLLLRRVQRLIVLYSNYPNPFNFLTTIKYFIPDRGHVKLEVFNILGQIMKTLVDNTMDEGEHNLIWDISKEKDIPASGVYIMRLTLGESSSSRHIVILK